MTPSTSLVPLRVLVVDDSAINRRNLTDILAASPEVQVVGKAHDGEDAIRQVMALRPDVITLDLEMPRMDGFTFLRILMTKLPTPVIVVSSYTQKENVFKALELGALDFVTKPDPRNGLEQAALAAELVRKVTSVRGVRPGPVLRVPRAVVTAPEVAPVPSSRAALAPLHVVVIGASTGGPTALMEIFAALPSGCPDAFLVAQHMPDKFTRTFAERLQRGSRIRVSEAQDGDSVGQGMALVCPGGHCMELQRSASQLTVRVSRPEASDRYVPSVDRLFGSAARVFGAQTVGVILTGMGDDGALGARAILEASGVVFAESEATAVVYGMPGSAVRAGVVTQSLPLEELGSRLAALSH
jgi:two-component system chemotaxis response regulator CheB